MRLLNIRDDPSEVMFNIPWLELSISHVKFDLIRHSITAYSCADLFIRAFTSKVSFNLPSEQCKLIKDNFQTADELVTYTIFSFCAFVYSLVNFMMQFSKFTKEQKIVQLIMNFAAVLNLMFLLCFIFENCQQGCNAKLKSK